MGESTRTIVVGLGNPLRRDDGAGLAVARLVREQLDPADGVEVEELAAGGLRLAETISGFDRAVVVDAMTTGNLAAGAIRRLTGEELGAGRNLSCQHDSSLPAALDLWRRLGAPLPREISFWGIEAGSVEGCSEELSEPVRLGVERAAEAILAELRGGRP